MNFSDTLWLIVSSFFFVAYLIVLFHIIVDLFRDPKLGGFAKALWMIGLVFVPMLTALIYVIARGSGMAERQRSAALQAKSEADDYIRQAAGRPTPADQIVSAKRLLDDGTITQDEFMRIKATALA